MNKQAHAHAHALALTKALERKAALLQEQAEYADACKGGASKLARSLEEQAADCRTKAAELRQALALDLYLATEM